MFWELSLWAQDECWGVGGWERESTRKSQCCLSHAHTGPILRCKYPKSLCPFPLFYTHTTQNSVQILRYLYLKICPVCAWERPILRCKYQKVRALSLSHTHTHLKNSARAQKGKSSHQKIKDFLVSERALGRFRDTSLRGSTIVEYRALLIE